MIKLANVICAVIVFFIAMITKDTFILGLAIYCLLIVIFISVEEKK